MRRSRRDCEFFGSLRTSVVSRLLDQSSEVSTDSDKYVGGKSSRGIGHYSGPCAPPGNPHHYTFIIIATDLDAKALPPGLTLPELHTKLAGHTKGTAGLIGLFAKPAN